MRCKIGQQPVVKRQQRTGKEHVRTGVYASGIIATLLDGHDIVLFQSNIGHAGEFIDEILVRRTPGGPPPIVMSDALSSNRPTASDVVHSLYNAHGRRQFVDIIDQFRNDVSHVLQLYKQIWNNENLVREQALSDSKRLDYDKTHSLPVMEEIRTQCH